MTRTGTGLRAGGAGTKFLEPLVPVLSFGGTFAGIFMWSLGFHFGIQYAALGSLMGSCILAYLAWIRQKKDIVSLTTPIYGFIFFVVPADYLPGIVLQLLFAAGLTILLVRLKYRFGASDEPVPDRTVLAASLKTYTERVQGSCSALPQEVAQSAGEVFTRFAQGDYEDATCEAGLAVRHLETAGDAEILIRAFSIVREQATRMGQSLHPPECYLKFAPEYSPLLANPNPVPPDEEQEYHTTLYNALLLLYATAWNRSGADRKRLLACQDFALKLFTAVTRNAAEDRNPVSGSSYIACLRIRYDILFCIDCEKTGSGPAAIK